MGFSLSWVAFRHLAKAEALRRTGLVETGAMSTAPPTREAPVAFCAFPTGWAAIFSFQPPQALFALAIMLVSALAADALLVRRRLAPGWWMKLRVPLSFGLALCCALSGWALIR